MYFEAFTKIFPNPCGVNVILWFLFWFCGYLCRFHLDKMDFKHASTKIISIDGCYSLNSQSILCAYSPFSSYHVQYFSFYCSWEAKNRNYLLNLRQKWFVFHINNKKGKKAKVGQRKMQHTHCAPSKWPTYDQKTIVSILIRF